MSQRDLADRIAMDRSDLVKLLDELEDAGEVRRAPDPADRRRHVLSIPTGGTQTLRRGERIVDQATDQVLARLDSQQKAALHRLVRKALGAPD